MAKVSTYTDIEKIIEKDLPRVIYLPYKMAVRTGNEVYIKLLPHGRYQTTRRLFNHAEIDKLPLVEADVLESLVSMAKEAGNYLKVKSKYLTIADIAKDNELKRLGYKKQTLERYMKKFIEAGYIEQVTEDGTVKLKLTSKTILPDRPNEKFKVVGV